MCEHVEEKLVTADLIHKLKLNLGSGARLRKGYVNIDSHKLDIYVPEAPNVTYINDGVPSEYEYLQMNVFDIPLRFLSGTVDEVYASHFFEHLDHAQIVELLYILWDCMKPGAKITIITPNFIGIMKMYERKHRADNNFSDLDLLHTKIFNCVSETLHKSIWSPEIGVHYLTREGFFNVVDYTQGPNLNPHELTFVATKIA